VSLTKIEWTDRTWNPLTGCTKVSPGCDHCYAKTMHERFNGPGSFDKVTLHPGRLGQPLHWRKPSMVFVNSMSDLFHQDVPDEYIARVFAVMALSPQHTFQVLTKRHARMRSLLTKPEFAYAVAYTAGREFALTRNRAGKLAPRPHLDSSQLADPVLPLPNVWLGVSVENQQWADIRIPALLDTPAAVRFLSCEPLLGPIDLREYLYTDGVEMYSEGRETAVDWVIVGGESGPGARPMDPSWVLLARNQCVAAGVPFLFKQWGEYRWLGYANGGYKRVGKKAAGRELDGRTWDEYPERAA
jgi:protein gp37